MNIMKISMASSTATTKRTRAQTISRRTQTLCALCAGLLAALTVLSLFTGKYPLSLGELLEGNTLQRRIFMNLRVSRTIVGVVGGFVLGVSGFVYQTLFRNPLASPDIIGVSSGASAGAAAGILLFSGQTAGTGQAAAATQSAIAAQTAVAVCAFGGALSAVAVVLALSALDRTGKNSSIVLAGIAVHALAQTALMCLKLTADPERELASIEFWIMGSLSGISIHSLGGNLLLCLFCLTALFLLHRHIIILSGEEGEVRMLGVSVGKLRLLVLVTATLAVSAVISLTGLISFIGLLAPHGARLFTRDNRPGAMLLGGLMGGILLLGADILARSVTSVELPVSIFTSLLGAPFLIILIVRKGKV